MKDVVLSAKCDVVTFLDRQWLHTMFYGHGDHVYLLRIFTCLWHDANAHVSEIRHSAEPGHYRKSILALWITDLLDHILFVAATPSLLDQWNHL